jgi:replicative DNA helicase
MTDQLPQDIDTEESVLAACLDDENCLIQTLDVLVPQDFYKTSHQKLFRVFRDLNKVESPVNINTVNDLLQKRNELKEVGATNLANLITNVPPKYNIHYAKMVKDKALLREIITKAREVEQSCYQTENVAETLDAAPDKANGHQLRRVR